MDSPMFSSSSPTSEGAAARRSIAILRRSLFSDAGGFRERVRAAVRLSVPACRPGDDALIESLVGVCLQTVLDPYDASRAEQALAREAPRDETEAIEALCDWTVRRELARIRRAERARGPGGRRGG